MACTSFYESFCFFSAVTIIIITCCAIQVCVCEYILHILCLCMTTCTFFQINAEKKGIIFFKLDFMTLWCGIKSWMGKQNTEQWTTNSKAQNAITKYNIQLAEQLRRKDCAKSQSKTNRTLIKLNQSHIMKLITVKEIDTLGLGIKWVSTCTAQQPPLFLMCIQMLLSQKFKISAVSFIMTNWELSQKTASIPVVNSVITTVVEIS